MSSQSNKYEHLSCCDPFKCHKKLMRKGLRAVSENMRSVHRDLNLKIEDKLCTVCRKRVAEMPIGSGELLSSSKNLPQSSEGLRGESSSPDSDGDSPHEMGGAAAGSSKSLTEVFISPDDELSVLNQTLVVFDESPVIKRKANTRVNYVAKKARSIESAVKRKLEIATGTPIPELNDPDSQNPETEMLDQLKEKFKLCTKNSDKVQVLTVLPKSWTLKKVAEEFETSDYMARKARKLVEEKGILSTPNVKAGKTLAQKTVQEVNDFYHSNEVSRIMPGKKDYISVTVDGERQHVQKRLIMCNVKEAFQLFKEKHPDLKIGFSKFAELRPKQCILAGGDGTHSVCVCTIHQNTKLMFLGAKLPIITGGQYLHYQHCLAAIQCNPPRIQCFLGNCDECPGIEKLQKILECYFDQQMIDQVQFKQWTTTDRSSLETKIQSSDEFIRSFTTSLPRLLHHDFIAKQQSRFLQESKEKLLPGEVIILGDFAENYSFIVQDAAQSFHWNNLQATIHPFVCYYVEETSGELQHINFVVIAESNIHDTTAVHLFQKILLQFLASRIGQPKYIKYFSDGCAAQYKNRKMFVNLCHHELDFGVAAEWHFFATSHGKSPCDGIGGTVKRLAARASLQRPYDNQIITSRQLFEFGQSEINGINFYYATVEQHEQESQLLAPRFLTSRTIPGTHRLHCFRPISKEKMEVRDFSSSLEGRIEAVSININECSSLDIGIIKGYATVEYDGFWWLSCVLQTFPESGKRPANLD